MSGKTYIPNEGCALESQIGATLESLCRTIESRREAGEESYTYQLLAGPLDNLLKKICEESLECSLAAKDVEAARRLSCGAAAGCVDSEAKDAATGCADDATCDVDAQIDHLRYECGDSLYHTLVLAARFGISVDELAAELNQRMTAEERPSGCILLKDEHVRRRL